MIGSCIAAFTEIPGGDHAGYNAWHLYDHLPEVRTVPGIVLGQRWVASPRCRSASPVVAPPFDVAHYFTLYLVRGPTADTLEDIGRLSAELEAADRTFSDRRTVVSFVREICEASVSTGAGVSVAAVPFRPSRGIAVVVVDGPVEPTASELVELDGVTGAWSFGSDDDRLTVAWLDEDPVSVGRRLEGGLAGRTVRLAATYEPVDLAAWTWFDS